jgi:hypothetical protein
MRVPCWCCSVLQAVLEQRAEFGKRVVRKVPVEWIGVASEVKVMGDFDDWTRGHELSAEDVATDSVYSRWVGAAAQLTRAFCPRGSCVMVCLRL